LNRNESGRFGALKSDSTHHFFRNGTRLAAASDKVYQLLAHGQWFSLGIPASSTTKAGRHDIAEILLKVALKHQNFNQSTLCNIHPVNYTLLSCQKYKLTFVL
jgi:hypothetical protein